MRSPSCISVYVVVDWKHLARTASRTIHPVVVNCLIGPVPCWPAMGRFQRYRIIPGRCPELSPLTVICFKDGLRPFFGKRFLLDFRLSSRTPLSHFSSFLYMNVVAAGTIKVLCLHSIHIPIDGDTSYSTELNQSSWCYCYRLTTDISCRRLNFFEESCNSWVKLYTVRNYLAVVDADTDADAESSSNEPEPEPDHSIALSYPFTPDALKTQTDTTITKRVNPKHRNWNWSRFLFWSIYSSLRQILPRQCRKMVGITLTTITIADPMPALGAIPTVSNMGANLS